MGGRVGPHPEETRHAPLLLDGVVGSIGVGHFTTVSTAGRGGRVSTVLLLLLLSHRGCVASGGAGAALGRTAEPPHHASTAAALGERLRGGDVCGGGRVGGSSGLSSSLVDRARRPAVLPAAGRHAEESGGSSLNG